MSEFETSWCWRCEQEHVTTATRCDRCGGELHSSPPPASSELSHETLEIDLSGMEPSQRDLFLLFLDGADIHHELRGLLLSISASDEQRIRDLLETITADTLVELDPTQPADDSAWSRSVAAMMHPSARAPDQPVMAGTGPRVGAALMSYFIWWLLVVLLYGIATVFVSGTPSFTVTLVTSLVPLIGDIWLTAVYGTTPGKYLINIKVQNPSGQVPGWTSSIVRVAVMNWPVVVAYAPNAIGHVAIVITPFWMAFLILTIARDPDHRGLHDRIAHTQVVVGPRRHYEQRR